MYLHRSRRRTNVARFLWLNENKKNVIPPRFHILNYTLSFKVLQESLPKERTKKRFYFKVLSERCLRKLYCRRFARFLTGWAQRMKTKKSKNFEGYLTILVIAARLSHSEINSALKIK